ncbi:hypothetical protein [Streptomyces sp. NPDC057889]|uniref:hypothetical protein n=1 Tax=unclassified Streptomyces TaxID=2593676 RepID=UPI00367E1A78
MGVDQVMAGPCCSRSWLLRLLQLIAAEGLAALSDEAEWFAREIDARIPLVN